MIPALESADASKYPRKREPNRPLALSSVLDWLCDIFTFQNGLRRKSRGLGWIVVADNVVF